MSTHQGNTITDLVDISARVDNALALSPRRRLSSVDRPKLKGWTILIAARTHLCNHVMDGGDIQAWWVMADLQDELLTEASKTCVAPIPTNATGEEAAECGQPTIGDSEMCAKHLGESGI